MSSVIMQARWGVPNGYGSSAEQMALALDALGIDLRHRATPWPQLAHIRDARLRELAARPLDDDLPQISYEPVDLFDTTHSGYRIGYTMLEVDGLPADWVAICNTLDEIWTPSAWGAQVFADAGIRRPIHVLPLGYNPQRFHTTLPPAGRSPRYTFLSVFEWGERKAPELLLRAYHAAFTRADDVLLIVRTNNSDGDVDVARQIAELGLGDNGPLVAMLYNQQLAPDQLGQLYASADCFVLPTRGEGFGLPILEAMACGLPVIATDWSGQTAFFDASVGYPIRVRHLVHAVAKCPYYLGHRWAEPDFDHLVALMQQVYRDPAAARVRGAAAAAAAAQWTWQRAAARIAARLELI